MQIRMKCPVSRCSGVLRLTADGDRGYDLPIVITCNVCGTGFNLAGGNLRMIPNPDTVGAVEPTGTVVARALP